MAIEMRTLQFKRPTCGVSLDTKKSFKKHKKIHRSACGTCCSDFKTIRKYRVHQKATGHCHCRQCKKNFSNITEHVLHVREKPHAEQYQCCDCNREYPDPHTLKRHCCVCDQIFKTKEQLKKHMTSNDSHRNYAPSGRRFQCSECEKEFQDANALDQHKRSKAKPLRIIPCPMDSKCRKKFATPSALFNHLESAGCKSGIDRQKLNQLVIHYDKDYHITNKSSAGDQDRFVRGSFSPDPISINQETTTDYRSNGMLTPLSQGIDDASLDSLYQAQLTPDIEDTDFIGGVLLPSPASNIASSWSVLPTPQAWDLDSATDGDLSSLVSPHRPPFPQQQHCPLCPRTFGKNTALQMHIASAAHAPKIFHCPVALTPAASSKASRRRQEKWFSTLSGLTRHLEAGACRGGMATFRNAVDFVEEQLRLCGLGSVKLLVEGNRSLCSH